MRDTRQGARAAWTFGRRFAICSLPAKINESLISAHLSGPACGNCWSGARGGNCCIEGREKRLDWRKRDFFAYEITPIENYSSIPFYYLLREITRSLRLLTNFIQFHHD